ncbi:T9SS type B sorting domain-containing protein [Allomuricauda sp. d1]|uniref:T9SS type B sorting domain-containing protein n=1 Tax=Allomuricauda sp. d1 TaxID=3136725 RepID=UPI0031D84F18
MVKHFGFLYGFLFCGMILNAQVAADCANAIPICDNTPVNGGTNGYGVDDFNGASQSGCLERTQSGSIESNSAWYRFRTNASGQLGFNIGHDSSEDWDFALYRATDCNSLGDPIRCNFFDNSDQKSYVGVGEDPSGDSGSVLYEDWLQVNAGEDYYLFINNFSSTNSGFSIQFSGEIFVTNPYDALDCSIIDNLLGPPIAACDGETITLDATTSGAVGYNWYANYGSGFQIVTGENGPTYTVANDAIYRVEVLQSGPNIISDVQIAFTTAPMTQPVADDVYCHDGGTAYDLLLKDMEALGAQDPNLFNVSYHASQADAINGMNPLNKQYQKPVGSETIFIRVTSMENSRCFDASQSFELNAIQNPVLNIETDVPMCDNAPMEVIGETMPDPNYTYMWDTGETTPAITVGQPGNYTLTATNTASGITCNTVRTVRVTTSASPRITDIEIDEPQLSNTVTVITDVEGDFEYSLDDGGFQTSNVFEEVFPGAHTITMRDLFGCGVVTEQIVVVGFMNHFSPNGDGINENWHVDGLSNLNSAVVTIYDRYGKLLAQLNESSVGWDGNFNGLPLPSTDYWFKLSYVNQEGVRTYAKYLQNHFSLRR